MPNKGSETSVPDWAYLGCSAEKGTILGACPGTGPCKSVGPATLVMAGPFFAERGLPIPLSFASLAPCDRDGDMGHIGVFGAPVVVVLPRHDVHHVAHTHMKLLVLVADEATTTGDNQ